MSLRLLVPRSAIRDPTPTNRGETVVTWLVENHIQPRHFVLGDIWANLVSEGAVAPIAWDIVHYTVVGGSALIYSNAPEAVLMGIDPSDPDLINRHADLLVNLFLGSTQP